MSLMGVRGRTPPTAPAEAADGTCAQISSSNFRAFGAQQAAGLGPAGTSHEPASMQSDLSKEM